MIDQDGSQAFELSTRVILILSLLKSVLISVHISIVAFYCWIPLSAICIYTIYVTLHVHRLSLSLSGVNM